MCDICRGLDIRIARVGGDDNEGDDIHQDARKSGSKYGKQYVCQTDKRGVDVEIFGYAAADAAQHFIGVRAIQFFGCHGCFSLLFRLLLAQLSFSPTMRLKIRRSAVLSLSLVKYPVRMN